MRVIAGSLRGKILSGFQGDAVRPTSDKARGAVFSALLSRIGRWDGTRVLDMFAGSGALSIEALSRGAEHAVLFDSAPASQRLVARNLRDCRLEKHATLIRGDVFRLLDRAKDYAPFDIVFIDPPYQLGLARKALELVVTPGVLHCDSWVVVETARGEELPESVAPLELEMERAYGGTTIRYYKPNPASEG